MQKPSQFAPLLPPLAASTPVESPAESDLTKSISSDASAPLRVLVKTWFQQLVHNGNIQLIMQFLKCIFDGFSFNCDLHLKIMQKPSQFAPLLPPLAASTPVESPAESDLTKSISSDASAPLRVLVETWFQQVVHNENIQLSMHFPQCIFDGYSLNCDLHLKTMQKPSQLGPLLPPLAASTPVESPAESDLTKSISSDASAALIPETSTPFERPLPSAPFAVSCFKDYHSDDPIYLSFCKDEILQVVDCDSRSGWWQAQRKVGGSDSYVTIGWIPQAYVQPLQSESDDWTSEFGDQTDDTPSSVPEFHHTISVLKALPTAALEFSSVKPIQNYRFRFLEEAQPQNETIPKVSTPIASPFSSFKSRDWWGYILSPRSEAELLTQEIGEKRSELGAPALFNGSEQFSINGGAFNAVGRDMHETSTTTNSGNTSFVKCVFNYARSRSDSRRESSATATTPQDSKFQKKNCRKRRWSITKFTHIFNHVYHHYFPAAMYYPMYYVPWFTPWCQNCAGFS